MANKWVYMFSEGDMNMRNLLGGKGANLAEMTSIGLPVPQGFTVTTEACTQYYEDGRKINDEIMAQIMDGVKEMEKINGKEFGSLENPLLVSVRSGARASMPGMMDTILNLGLNDDVVAAMIAGNPDPAFERFVYDSYRRFIQMFSDVVMEVGKKYFEQLIDKMKEEKGVKQDVDLDADDLKKLAQKEYGTDTITLTPSPKGADYSEDGYADKYGDENSEATIRKNGDPLNSHKFSYDDFGIGSGDETTKITPEALTVVMRAKDNQNVTRIMYGGGLNVEAGTPADTEKAKAKIGRDEAGNVTDDSLAGFKKDGNAGYWYNDIGTDSYDDVAKNLENVGYKIGSPDTENGLVQIQNGKDLKEQSFGDYVQVTWDVPEDVKQYADAASGKTISFQLWYGEIEAEEYTPLESLDIDSAMLTYTEELTFPYKSQTKELTINKELKTGDDPLEILYSDLGMTYETTADVYAIEFTLDSKVDARQLVLGNGTTVVDKASDYWYQAGSIALVKSDDKNHEYTYMWIMPADVANVTLAKMVQLCPS